MFTGIIEEKGRIIKIIKGKTSKIEIQSNLNNKIGDSIAIQGICLTITDVFRNGFSVEVMMQTREITTLPNWKSGDYVNLERAVAIGERIGGHIVLGHIDEKGRLLKIRGNEYYFRISPENKKYLIPKGCVAIDGVSLTIGEISGNTFSVYLIPYTLNNTTLGLLRVGSSVNIEYDYFVKMIRRSLY